MLVSERSNPSPTVLRMALPSDARLALCGLSGHRQATKVIPGARGKADGRRGVGGSEGGGYKRSGGGALDINTVVDLD